MFPVPTVYPNQNSRDHAPTFCTYPTCSTHTTSTTIGTYAEPVTATAPTQPETTIPKQPQQFQTFVPHIHHWEDNAQITIYYLCTQSGQIKKRRRTLGNTKIRKNKKKRKKKIGMVPDRKNNNPKVINQIPKIWPLLKTIL